MPKVNNNNTISVDENGDTPLHHLMRKGFLPDNSFVNILREFIETVGVKAASRMARTVNDAGELPIDIFIDLNCDKHASPPHIEEVINILVDLATKQHKYKSLSHKLSIEEVAKKYNVTDKNSKLYKNLADGCAISNKVRDLKLQSLTHTDSNQYDNNTKDLILHKIEKMREIQTKLKQIHINTYKDDQNALTDALLDGYTQLAISNGVGDCNEFALIAWHFCREEDKKNNIEPRVGTRVALIGGGNIHGKNADHVLFLMDPGSDAVMIDAHGGKVYPYQDKEEVLKESVRGHRVFDIRTLQQKLGINIQFKNGKTTLDCTTIYNPKYHELAAYSLVQASSLSAAKSSVGQKLMCYGLFAALGVAALATTASYMLAEDIKQNQP